VRQVESTPSRLAEPIRWLEPIRVKVDIPKVSPAMAGKVAELLADGHRSTTVAVAG